MSTLARGAAQGQSVGGVGGILGLEEKRGQPRVIVWRHDGGGKEAVGKGAVVG